MRTAACDDELRDEHPALGQGWHPRGSESFLRFALPAAPAGTTLTGVTFAYRTSTDTTSGSVDPFSLDVSTPATWDESLINWNNRPTGVGANVATLNAPAVNTAYEATGNPAALRAALGQNVSLRISGSSNDNIRPWSREHGAAPAARLTFTPDSGGRHRGADDPSGVTSSVSDNDVTLSWGASTDNVGVAGYTVYRGTSATSRSVGSKVADTNASTLTLQDQNRPANTYYYRVVARDAAGNTSVRRRHTRSMSWTRGADGTDRPPGERVREQRRPDVVGLERPSGSPATACTAGRRRVRRDAGQDRRRHTTSYTDSSVPAGTYYYKVVAKDASNNASPASGAATATVAAPPAETQTVRLNPTADAYASAALPTTNYGTNTQLSAKGGIRRKRVVPAVRAAGSTSRHHVDRGHLRVPDLDRRHLWLGGPVLPRCLHRRELGRVAVTWNNRPTGVGANVATLNAPAVNTAYQATGNPAALQAHWDRTSRCASAGRAATTSVRGPESTARPPPPRTHPHLHPLIGNEDLPVASRQRLAHEA